jgi:curli production assembly/transport component CsgG
MRSQTRMLLVVLATVLAGCAVQLATVGTERARVGSGYVTSIHQDLMSLPAPEQKIVVAVYKFRDQTGQYKPNSTATSFSTAVTQGATSMLIKALEDSNWFTVIEREALPNLLSERKIIRQTREAFLTEEQRKTMEPLPPLMYAGVLLEGGIISYDTDFVTGALGAKYFGIGGSGEVRADHLSIYLRAVGTKNGQVLKSIHTSKTVLSRSLDFGVFRFVRFSKLLEAEAGFSTNEPAQMCVLEAVEKAVYDMILEGVLTGLWKFKDPAEINGPTLQRYRQERDGIEVDAAAVLGKEQAKKAASGSGPLSAPPSQAAPSAATPVIPPADASRVSSPPPPLAPSAAPAAAAPASAPAAQKVSASVAPHPVASTPAIVQKSAPMGTPVSAPQAAQRHPAGPTSTGSDSNVCARSWIDMPNRPCPSIVLQGGGGRREQ